MKPFFLLFLPSLLLFSCATLPRAEPVSPAVPVKPPAALSPAIPAAVPAAVPAIAPERPAAPNVPVRPPLSTGIMGAGNVSGEQLALFLALNNPDADPEFVRVLSEYYIEEAAAEGVNHDAAFAQMCLETGFLRYGGLVTPDMNNFCGLGSIGPQEPGLLFPDARTGVRAHIQHLKAYASGEPLNRELVDPRYHYVRAGSSPTIFGLSGTWAADKFYSVKINGILERLYDSAF
jgi:hypothetical protein